MTEERSESVQRAGTVQAHDRLAVERWISEGGHIATEAAIERESAPGNAQLGGDAQQRHRAGEPTSKVGDAADVMPGDEGAIPVETTLGPVSLAHSAAPANSLPRRPLSPQSTT